MRKFTLDTIKMVILFGASEYLTEYIKEKHALNGAATLNPGEFADFPISQQQPLFALFGGAEKAIGVSLTTGGAIKPTKSRSGILFPQRDWLPELQALHPAKVPRRRAAYNPAAVKEYLGTPA